MGSDPSKVILDAPFIVSIRAPAWGATIVKIPKPIYRKVSIRAPAWGATHRRPDTDAWQQGFNSRSRMGSDTRDRPNCGCAPKFQFALPHGERLPSWMACLLISSFQFALPHGERRPGSTRLLHGCPFQFALPHGERPPQAKGNTANGNVSIRAPAWGATLSARQ